MTPLEEDIQTLLDGCKKNDRKAQEQLYNRFYSVMMAFCVRYTKNQMDAIEVLNDGFLKVFKNIHQYDAAKASVYTWIRKIVINASIDFLRKQTLKYTSIVPGTEEEPAIESEVIEKMDAEELLSMIRQLSPATQLVFNLYTVDGFNHREIGTMLGISEGTSKWHLSEARRQLKQIIQAVRLYP